MMLYCFYIEIIMQNCPLRRTVLPTGTTLIGRSLRSCGVVLDDGRVSRVHLQIRHQPETGVTVMDMHSANGSMLEGRALLPGLPIHWLPDQVVSVGRTHLVLRYGSLIGQEEDTPTAE